MTATPTWALRVCVWIYPSPVFSARCMACLVMAMEHSTIPIFRRQAGLAPRAVAIGGFNLDGNLHMAVAFYCTDFFGCTGLVNVYLGTGDGNFQDPLNYSYGGGTPLSISVGDFNGDGKPDLAIGDQFGGPETVTVLLGNGDGTFQIGAPFAFSVGFVEGDFNGDGKSDLVGVSGTNSIALLLGNDGGTFQPPININVSPGRLAAADFKCDGKLDVAVLRPTAQPYYWVTGMENFALSTAPTSSVVSWLLGTLITTASPTWQRMTAAT